MEPIDDRVTRLRAEMTRCDLDALIVPRADEYLGEYLPAYHERLRWATGFTGSAGTAILLRERGAIFVDGRYTVQVAQQVDASIYALHHAVKTPPVRWLAGQLEPGARVGFDPRMHSLDWVRAAEDHLGARGIVLVEMDENLIDRCWQDRPEPEVEPALLLDEAFTGRASADKRAEIGAGVVAQGADAALIFAPDSVAWLLNIRGRDVPSLPLLLGFALLEGDGRVTFFTDPRKIPAGFAAHVGEGVSVHAESEALAAFAALSGRTVLADPATANAWCQLALERAGAVLLAAPDPVILPKACKNAVEVQGMREAHVRDGVAETKFLAWLDAEVDAGRLHGEAALADRLFAFRAEQDRFRETSFDTISAAAANAALPHYHYADAPVASVLEMDSVYLVDSGGQYLDGTTDITRTVAIGDPGAEVRRRFTLVLKGHIALDRARFPAGTTGAQLDVLARMFLWREGLDYDHGTGHGVGAFLSVHEGPQRIAKGSNDVPLAAGMVISNEPGYYEPGAYGIRCENLVVVRDAEVGTDGGPAMLEFETLTLAPFDQRLLDVSLLDEDEIAWIDGYHARVREQLAPHLDPDERGWLEQATRPVAAARDAPEARAAAR